MERSVPVTLLSHTRLKGRRCSCEDSVFGQNAVVETLAYVPESEMEIRSLSFKDSQRALCILQQTALYPIASVIVEYLSDVKMSCLCNSECKWIEAGMYSFGYEAGSITILDASMINKHLEGDVDETVEDSDPDPDPEEGEEREIVCVPPRIQNLSPEVIRRLASLQQRILWVHAIREYPERNRNSGLERFPGVQPEPYEPPFSFKFKTHNGTYGTRAKRQGKRHNKRKHKRRKNKNSRDNLEMLNLALYDSVLC